MNAVTEKAINVSSAKINSKDTKEKLSEKVTTSSEYKSHQPYFICWDMFPLSHSKHIQLSVIAIFSILSLKYCKNIFHFLSPIFRIKHFIPRCHLHYLNLWIHGDGAPKQQNHLKTVQKMSRFLDHIVIKLLQEMSRRKKILFPNPIETK